MLEMLECWNFQQLEALALAREVKSRPISPDNGIEPSRRNTHRARLRVGSSNISNTERGDH